MANGNTGNRRALLHKGLPRRLRRSRNCKRNLGWEKGLPSPGLSLGRCRSFVPGGFIAQNGLKTALVGSAHEQCSSMTRVYRKCLGCSQVVIANFCTVSHAARTCRPQLDPRVWNLSSQKTSGLLGLWVMEGRLLHCVSFVLFRLGSSCGDLRDTRRLRRTRTVLCFSPIGRTRGKRRWRPTTMTML